MRPLLVLAPGPATHSGPGDDAGVSTLAALAVRSLRARGQSVITLSPSPLSAAATFATRAYGEPMTAHSIRGICEREDVAAVLTLFGGAVALEAALAVGHDAPILGKPEPVWGLRAFREPSKRARPEETRLVLEMIRDASGQSVVVGAFTAGGEGPITDAVLRMPVLARGVPWSVRMGDIIGRATASLEQSRAFGVFSLTYVLPPRGEPRVVERRFGARFSTVLAAAATRIPVAEIATRVALGELLRDIEHDGHPALVGAAWPEAVRKPVLAFGRFPGARPSSSGAVGQSLRVVDRRARAPEAREERDAPIRPTRRLIVLGAGPQDIDNTGARGLWAAAATLAAMARGRDVTVVDDDPGSLAGALADEWILSPPSDVALQLNVRGCDVLVASAPEPASAARVVEQNGGVACDFPSEVAARAAGLVTFRSGEAPALPKVGVLAFFDGGESRLVAAVEYVEPASVHTGDSAAFLPPQTVPAPLLAALEDQTRALAAPLGARGLVTATWVLSDVPALAALTLGPSTVAPFVERATGLAVADLSARLALGERLVDLEVPDGVVPDQVAARETALPRELLARTSVGLGPVRRSVGEAIGISETMASAYKKALAGVGFSLDRARTRAPAAVLLAPARADEREAVMGARKLHPLGYRILATPTLAPLLTSVRLPFEEVDQDAAALALEAGNVALALVTGLEGEGPAAALRNRALSADVPCFTSAVLFRAACAAIEEGVASTVTPLPSRTLGAGANDAPRVHQSRHG